MIIKQSNLMKKVEDIKNVAQTQLDNRMANTKPVKLGWTSQEIEKNFARVE